MSLFRCLFLFAISYIILYPLLYMLSNAFKPLDQAIDPSVVWVPRSLTMENFATAGEALTYGRSFFITVGVQLVSAVLLVGVCCVVGYGFARFEFREKTWLFGLVVLTIIVPPQAIIVPLYMNLRYMDVFGLLTAIGGAIGKDIRLNLIDTPFAFYLPALFGSGLRSGLFIFIYRQFFKGMPRELEEAAWVDGAGPLRTFVRIMLPSSGPALLTVFIFAIVWYWNDYQISSMLLNENFPLAVQLSRIQSQLHAMGMMGVNASEIRPVLMAGCFLFILPILLLYLFLQRFFIRSIERVGLVG